jgi:hypothetical protein
MSRYTFIPFISTPEKPERRYINVKYPSIPRDSQDIYVYVTQGDRYDVLAQTYYNDSTLWWIIARANATVSSTDSLYPSPGTQIRIPSVNRISTILGEYEEINRTL